ncbi:MAG: hypothetical protein JM58_08770 [Peptococcaceae bacterium BICA1-8]|nr:MAG: hypothetical protein JM58_08770 [Peptococcaceae bacterium BICA1-8]
MSLRIGGIASGLDTEQIVKDLMKVERTKVDKLEQNKVLLDWKQEIYNDLNKELANFILDSKKELGLSRTTSTGLYVNSSVSGLDWVKKATSTNTDVSGVSARADAIQGSYAVKVTQLATNWSAGSNDKITSEGGSTANLAEQFNLVDSDTVNFTITTNKGEVTINKTGLASVSINDIVNEINSADIGVTAIYDSNIDRFFLQTKETGSDNTMQITDSSTLTGGDTSFITGPTSTLKLQYIDDGGVSQNVTSGEAYSGQNANINFGAAQNIVQGSNQFAINGINFDLKAEGDFTVQVATDVDGVYEKVSGFVTKYNELVSKFSEKLGEKRYRDYTPLTQEQKDTMSEKEVELWEEKAKSGLIKEDMIVSRTMQSMRSGFYEEVEGVSGVFSQLTQIGISTDSYFSGTGGQLVINETKLKTAIRDNVDGVLELLFKEPEDDLKSKTESSMTASEIEQKRSQSGLIRRLFDNMVVGMKDIVSKAGAGSNADLYRNVSSSIMINFVTNYGSISILDKDANGLNKRIDQMKDYLIRTEDRYWKQFTSMETALQRMNSQSSWLMQQFGGE